MKSRILRDSFQVLPLFFFQISICFAQPLTDFLQADYSFEQGSLEDLSPNMIPGAGTDLIPTLGLEGTSNSAFQFNGTSSYIDCSTDNRSITNELTISVWFKTSSSERQTIVSKYDYRDDAGFFVGIIDGFVRFGGRDGSDTFIEMISEGIRVDDGRWHHVVGTVDVNDWKLYIDCQLVRELTTASADPLLAMPDPLTIGKLSVPNGFGEDLFFQGVIDNVKMYNTAATEEELPDISLYSCPAAEPALEQTVIKRFFGDDPTGANVAAVLPDNNLLIVGTVNLSASVTGMLVVKCTPAGMPLWTQKFAALGMETPRSVLPTSDGGYAIIGMTTSGSLGAEDILLVKLDADGDLLWSKVYGGDQEDRGFGLIETPDHYLLLSGSTRSFGSGQRDALLIKTDLDGDLVWSRTFGGVQNDIFQGFDQVSATQYVLLGITVSYGSGSTDLWLITVDDQGNLISGRTYGRTGDQHAIEFQRTADNGFIVAGHILSSSISVGNYDGTVFKINAAGNVDWAKSFGGIEADFVRGLTLGADEHIFLSGTTSSIDSDSSDLFLLEVAPDGSLIEARTYGQSGNDYLAWVTQDALINLPKDRLLMLGTLRNEGKDEMFFANFSPDRMDECLGKDWDLTYDDYTYNVASVTPTTGTPALEQDDLLFTTMSYPLEMDFLSSDFCPVDLVISANSTPCSYQASNSLSTSGPVEFSGNITFKAGNNITLSPGFAVGNGNQFTAKIEDCSADANLSAMPSLILEKITPPAQLPVREGSPFRIFPNPAHTSFTVQIESGQEAEAHLRLYNASGILVQQPARRFQVSAGQNQREIDVSDLPSGLYFVHYWTKHESYTEKLFVR